MRVNRVCLNCGTVYYCCASCTTKNSWKNYCCTTSCYRQYIDSDRQDRPQILENGGKKMNIVLRAMLLNGKTIDIIGYDLELGKFDCSDKVTRECKDFSYFIVPHEEMGVISNRLKDALEKSAHKLLDLKADKDIRIISEGESVEQKPKYEGKKKNK